ncbi:hypothetical protein WN943_015530 [Citrus x changshan-huyou]
MTSDDKELEKGESISPRLLKAIEASRIAIIVFSKNYASSTWCLDELVHILDCKNKNAQRMVYPIFYDVEPTVVRNQTGNFQEAFAKHVEVFKKSIEKVQKWREALKEVATISGWELKEYRNESKFISDIVNPISSQIRVKSKILKKLVGIDSRLEELRFLMDKGPSADVRMIGICGMGGLGKTTIARVIYDLISHEFEGSSFLANVREKSEREGGVISFQRQLVSQLLKLTDNRIWNEDDGINILGSRLQHKKVLLVIDDVVDSKQLEYLAGGSRIIITSRDEGLLKTNGVDEVYKPNGLNYNEALQLFNMKAFKNNQPLEERVQLSERFVNYAGGIPLAIEVLGSFLNVRSVEQWRSTLERLQIDPPKKIMSRLQISFDRLQDSEKKIFLDIACFFKGKNRDYGGEVMEGIIVNAYFPENEVYLSASAKAFSQMTNLRLLKISNVQLPGGLEYLSNRLRLLDWHRYPLKSLPSNLQLDKTVEFKMCYSRIEELWKGIKPLKMLTVMKLSHSQDLIKTPNFTEVSNLEELDLEGCTRLREIHPSLLLHSKLIILNLKDCTSLTTLPGRISMKSLKTLVLSGCSKLIKKFLEFDGNMNDLSELCLDRTTIEELPLSIQHLTGLTLLNLKDCKNIKSLSISLTRLKCLRTLKLSGCSKFRKFPEIWGSMKDLTELFLDGTSITEVPSSIELLTGLQLLNLNNCNNLVRLPSAGKAVIGVAVLVKRIGITSCSVLARRPINSRRGSAGSWKSEMGLIDAVLINIWNVCDGIDIIRSRLRWKKVHLIIDDVSDVEQLQSLAGKRDWFGPGSKILITTRDKQLLVAHEVDEEILNLDVLNNDEALRLLSMKAFKTHQPVGEYVELSERVLEYAGGLPLALKVLGSFLIGCLHSLLTRLKLSQSPLLYPTPNPFSDAPVSLSHKAGLLLSETDSMSSTPTLFLWKL